MIFDNKMIPMRNNLIWSLIAIGKPYHFALKKQHTKEQSLTFLITMEYILTNGNLENTREQNKANKNNNPTTLAITTVNIWNHTVLLYFSLHVIMFISSYSSITCFFMNISESHSLYRNTITNLTNYWGSIETFR